MQTARRSASLSYCLLVCGLLVHGLVFSALSLCVSAQARPGPDLFAENTVRTLELQFVQGNWFNLLTSNYAGKTYIKADLKVDGITYKDVGVRFRGNSSYKAVTWTEKKPFKISLDQFVPGQALYGFRTINLINSFRDPTHMRTVLANWIMRKFIPAPRANVREARGQFAVLGSLYQCRADQQGLPEGLVPRHQW